ncbi:putative mitochondrial phosphate carrier protein (Ptp) [Metarhizium anisopliae]|nr:putative mitochondrial phosphate carrier protein (Ptp) [Metarhizium anisopliae]
MATSTAILAQVAAEQEPPSLGDKSKLSDGTQAVVNLGSGLIAGFAATIVSQPTYIMLFKMNKTKGLPGKSNVSRLIKIAGELGVRGPFAGLPTRLFVIGGLTAGQFAIYSDIKKALGKCALFVP